MQVEDVFRLGDGRTVLVGSVSGCSDSLVPALRCDLIVGGRMIQTLDLEGEMLAEKRSPSGLRSVSTFHAVELSEDVVRNADCRLRSTASA
jgi:hypothetical protein